MSVFYEQINDDENVQAYVYTDATKDKKQAY